METERDLKKIVIDEYKNLHEIREELSRGGQGIIYKTADPDVVIKLDLQYEQDDNDQELVMAHVWRRYQNIRLLPVPADFPIARPLASLEELPGYVMEFLNAMEPIQKFIDVGTSFSPSLMPEWMQTLRDKRLKQLFCHYRDTGGLLRRISVLARCAELLAIMHLRGILYGDVSPNNIFMSSMEEEQLNVWLIDSDNLCWVSSDKEGAVYTASYGAPEVILKKSGNSFYTDQYAFAMMAFQVLAMKFPFQGALMEVQEDEWDGDGICAADRAARGELPWIEEEDDDSNLDSPMGRALRRELIHSELLELFQQTFGRQGRTIPTHRPVMLRWAVALYKTKDCLVHCEHCGMDYYGGEEPESQCPYCEEHQVSAYTMRRLSSTGEVEWIFRLPDENGGDVPARVFRPFVLDKSSKRLLRFSQSPDKKQIIIEKDAYTSETLLWLEGQNETNYCRLSSKLRIPVTQATSTVVFKLEKSSSVIECIIKGQKVS